MSPSRKVYKRILAKKKNAAKRSAKFTTYSKKDNGRNDVL